jgi:photosystem II stability/assembly factor-like uncharacterized protein
VIAAGAQDGVFLTRDGGENWTRLSSPRAAWPRPVVSLAFDPADSNTLYAGTPHLAWKTTDCGATWHRLRRGMEEDSDVFSIEVDSHQSKRLFAGACSGIYRSLNGGGTWANLDRAVGAPFRTYVVARAPRSANVVLPEPAGLLVARRRSHVAHPRPRTANRRLRPRVPAACSSPDRGILAVTTAEYISPRKPGRNP